MLTFPSRAAGRHLSYNPAMKNALLALLLCAVPAAADVYDEIRARANTAAVKPFALDLGGLLGGAGFHSGRTLGFPGFDVTAKAMVQLKPNRDNSILRGAGVDAFGLPLVQVAVGLPMNLDVVAHGVGVQGVKVVGGGLRWGVFQTGELTPLPDLSVSGFADKVDHDAFKAMHYAFNAALSYGLPIFKPYVGFGWDTTTVEIKQANLPGVTGFKTTARGARLTGGVDIAPVPFFHLFGAYSLRHGDSGFDAGLGFRF